MTKTDVVDISSEEEQSSDKELIAIVKKGKKHAMSKEPSKTEGRWSSKQWKVVQYDPKVFKEKDKGKSIVGFEVTHGEELSEGPSTMKKLSREERVKILRT